jgi:alkylation response protein AidB-like acyl-CoA dehydrogenase
MAVTEQLAGLDIDTVRRFVDERIAPCAGEFDRTERIPRDVLDAVAETGLWGAVLPRSVGGTGTDMLTLGALHEEVGRGCSSVRSLLTVHTMVAWAVHRWGSDRQRERWLGGLASGAVLGSFCLTEPDAGSDTRSITTQATERGGRWYLNGRKKWITGGQLAALFLVFARSQGQLAAFLVPRDAPGVEVVPIRGALGTRGSMLAEVILHDVDAGQDALLGPPHFGSGMVMTGALDLGRYSVACGCVGIAQACLNACADYTTSRRVGESQLRDLQLIRAKMSDMVTGICAARLLYEQAGRLKDAGSEATIMATWMAKYFAASMASSVASDAVQIHGANGCSDAYPVQRLYRDAKVMEIIEGSTEIQQITIAEYAYRGRR